MVDKILVVGMGNAGRRHAKNAEELGLSAIPVDVHDSLEKGIAEKPLFAVVATPPSTHYDIAMRLASTEIPTLVEKPPVLTKTEIETLCIAFGPVPLAVGYQMRYMESLLDFRTRIEAGELGKIETAHAEFASDKWTRSTTYSPEIIVEASHELDLLCFLFGKHKNITARGLRVHATALIEFKDVWATLQLSGHSRIYRRGLEVYGDKDSCEWVFDEAENERAYRAELEAFAKVCRGERIRYVSGWDCVNTVALMEAAMREMKE